MTALEKITYRTIYEEIDAEDEEDAREQVLKGKQYAPDEKMETDQFEITEIEHVDFVRGDEVDGPVCGQCGYDCVVSPTGQLRHWDDERAEYDEELDMDHQAIREEI